MLSLLSCLLVSSLFKNGAPSDALNAKSARGTDGGLMLSTVSEYSIVPIFEQSVSVVVSFQAPASVSSADRPPLSLTVVLDRSGSMQGEYVSEASPDLYRRQN